MPKYFLTMSVALSGFALVGYVACQMPGRSASENAWTANERACVDGERSITLVNNCETTVVFAGAAGNLAGNKICASDADCPGSTCNVKTTPHVCNAALSCSKHSDCPGVNQYCNAATPSAGLPYCRQDSDCNTGQKQYCDKAAGVPGYLSGSCSSDGDCPANTVCDKSTQGGNRCAFYYCATNQCYFTPVPLDQPIPLNATACSATSDCTDPNQFCYAPKGTTGNCVNVPQNGNSWKLAPKGDKTTICVPTPWAGRVWPRTNCKAQGDSYLCDVGSCLGQNGKFSESCAQSGTNSPTLAELFFPVFNGQNSDFYDVSLVDGGNVPMQIAPDASSYNLATPNGVDSGSCPASPGSCEKKHKSSSWVCDSTLNKCVNKFQCSSPGCVSGCDQFGYGRQGAERNCKWSGDLAIAQSACPAELQTLINSVYVGCKSPKDACGSANPAATLNCAAYNDLYGCAGKYKASCYSSTDPNCCGCPSWEKDSCEGTNKTWEDVEKKYYQAFHDACPTAYSFPYDDQNSTFTCIGKSADVNVNYVLTFCPK